MTSEESNYLIDFQVSPYTYNNSWTSFHNDQLDSNLLHVEQNIQQNILNLLKINNQNIMDHQESPTLSDHTFFEEPSMEVVMGGTTNDSLKVQSIQFVGPKQNGIQKIVQLMEFPLIKQKELQNTQVQIKREIPTLHLKSLRRHLKRERKRRGDKTPLQQRSNGYFTKNFLQYGKKPHLDFLAKMGKSKKTDYFAKFSGLNLIRDKAGITLGDYLYMYNIVELEEVWQIFFSRKILFSAMMISRALTDSRLVISNFLYRFQEAFRTGNFDHIA